MKGHNQRNRIEDDSRSSLGGETLEILMGISNSFDPGIALKNDFLHHKGLEDHFSNLEDHNASDIQNIRWDLSILFFLGPPLTATPIY